LKQLSDWNGERFMQNKRMTCTTSGTETMVADCQPNADACPGRPPAAPAPLDSLKEVGPVRKWALCPSATTPNFQTGAFCMTTIATDTHSNCLYCGKRFARSQHSGRYRHGATRPIESSLYCCPAHKQAAYRRRKDIVAGVPALARRSRPKKERLTPRNGVLGASVTLPGTYPHTSVTRPEIPQGIQQPATPIFEGLRASWADIVQIEVFAPFRWEDRVSSGGVPIQVSRLRKSVLVRR
jgi:hypothetical protein